jgi:hypothetical protein
MHTLSMVEHLTGSLEIARRRFQKFNSNYIESIKIARRRYPPRDTNFPHWIEQSHTQFTREKISINGFLKTIIFNNHYWLL